LLLKCTQRHYWRLHSCTCTRILPNWHMFCTSLCKHSRCILLLFANSKFEAEKHMTNCPTMVMILSWSAVCSYGHCFHVVRKNFTFVIGSGKTAAFLIPILSRIFEEGPPPLPEVSDKSGLEQFSNKWLSKVSVQLLYIKCYYTSFSTNKKQYALHPVVKISPEPGASCRLLLWILIVSSSCLVLFWCFRVIALLLIFCQSFGNCSISIWCSYFC